MNNKTPSSYNINNDIQTNHNNLVNNLVITHNTTNSNTTDNNAIQKSKQLNNQIHQINEIMKHNNISNNIVTNTESNNNLSKNTISSNLNSKTIITSLRNTNSLNLKNLNQHKKVLTLINQLKDTPKPMKGAQQESVWSQPTTTSSNHSKLLNTIINKNKNTIVKIDNSNILICLNLNNYLLPNNTLLNNLIHSSNFYIYPIPLYRVNLITNKFYLIPYVNIKPYPELFDIEEYESFEINLPVNPYILPIKFKINNKMYYPNKLNRVNVIDVDDNIINVQLPDIPKELLNIFYPNYVQLDIPLEMIFNRLSLINVTTEQFESENSDDEKPTKWEDMYDDLEDNENQIDRQNQLLLKQILNH